MNSGQRVGVEYVKAHTQPLSERETLNRDDVALAADFLAGSSKIVGNNRGPESLPIRRRGSLYGCLTGTERKGLETRGYRKLFYRTCLPLTPLSVQ